MKLRLLLAAFCLFAMGAQGCLNEYLSNKEARAFFQPLAQALKEEHLIEPWAVRAARLQKEVEALPTLENRNDLAVALLHLNQAGEAIAILQQIEKEAPGKYQTATNLGTAYELAGRNDEALWWIEEGVRRNPHSHEGSEWIHIAILQKKIDFAKNGVPAELGSILGIHDAQESLPTADNNRPQTSGQVLEGIKARGPLPPGNNGRPQTLDQVLDGIKAQLQERLPLVPAPDYFVASLLWDLGRLYERKTKEPGAGDECYRMAMDYLGTVQSAELEMAYIAGERSAGSHRRAPHYRHSFWQELVESAPIALATWGCLLLPILPIAVLRHRKNIRTAFEQVLVVMAVMAVVVVLPWIGVLMLARLIEERLSGPETTLFIFGVVFLTAIIIRIVHRAMRTKFPGLAKA